MNTLKTTTSIFALIASLFLNSCSNETIGESPVSTKKLTLNVTGFSESTGPITKSTRISDALSHLTFVIFDEKDGDQVKEINQFSIDEGFGSVTIDLPEGDYKLSVVGQLQNPLSDIGEILAHNFNSAQIFFSGTNGNGDLFFKNESFKISTTENTEINLALDRIAAQLEVNITDTFPANAGAIHIVVKNEESIFSFNGTNDPEKQIYKTIYGTYDVNGQGSNRFTAVRYHLNTTHEMDVDINCYSNIYPHDLIVSRTIKVNLEKNKKTILTSATFFQGPAPAPGNGTVIVDPTWGESTEQEF